MAINKRITECTENTAALAAGDMIAVVDVSDTTDAPSGTTKKQSWLNTIKFLLAAVFAEDAGSTDTYVAALSPVPVAYVIGQHYRFKANTANTGPCTVNFNSLGAKTIKKAAGGITTDLADNDIRAGQWVDLVYDGTNMQMQSLLGNAPAGGGGGTNPTDTVIPYNNAGTFADSPLTRTSATVITTTAGLLFSPDNTLNIGADGATRPSHLYLAGAARVGNGSATTPTFSFDSDEDTGMYRNGSNSLGFATGGSPRWLMNSGGDWFPNVDDSQDMGSATFRVRDVYVVKVRYSATVFDAAGTGSPEGVVTAGVGSTYRNLTGGAGTSFYVKESGTGNTGWIAK